jgi:hypothetical protein
MKDSLEFAIVALAWTLWQLTKITAYIVGAVYVITLILP